jgi:hypothetical protein
LQKAINLLYSKYIVETTATLVDSIINIVVDNLRIDHAELLHTFTGSMDLQELLAIRLDENSNVIVWKYSSDKLDVLLVWWKVISCQF